MKTIDDFAALHRANDPLVLFNVWDAGSATAVAEAGAKAIATGSLSLAGAQGETARACPSLLCSKAYGASPRRSTCR